MKISIQYLSIIIPIFNEESLIGDLFIELKKIKKKFKEKFKNVEIEVIIVNDGSIDQSEELIKGEMKKFSNINLISLSRNFGHQNAILAGISECTGDHIVIIDGDLQDPFDIILQMYDEAVTNKVDNVVARRIFREKETFFKRFSANVFYKLFNFFSSIKIIENVGDFRLFSRRVANIFLSLEENEKFIRALIPWIGFKTSIIDYRRLGRHSGQTKYPFNKMLALAINGILSFSSSPIIFAVKFGVSIILIGCISSIYLIYLKLFTDATVEGITAVLVSIIFFSGVIISLIGIIGLYIGKIYNETKKRPSFIIKDKKYKR